MKKAASDGALGIARTPAAAYCRTTEAKRVS